MKPLICPQCGGKITSYLPLQNFATCGYCETKIVIEKQTSASRNKFVDQPIKTFNLSSNVIVGFIAGAGV